MLRDGQFLQEPPIKIGAHYVRPFRHEPNDNEVFIQSVLLNAAPPKPKSRYDIIAGVIGIYLACVVAVGLVKGW